MLIIGCDYHPSFQQIAFVNTDTGELQERRLEHREEAEKFYRDLAVQGIEVRVGMEASGQARWFERLLAELNFELWIGDATEIARKRERKQKTDRQDAQHILHLLLKDDFPQIWVLTNPSSQWNSQRSVPRQAKNSLKMAHLAHCRHAGDSQKACDLSGNATLGTDLQRYGTMKDAQQILRHASIRTTANVYMQQIPASVVAAINARTRAILMAGRELSSETQNPTGSNGLQFESRVSASA